MTPFIIKSGLSMVLFFGLYWFFLRKEKLFVFNRYFLIFSIVVSLAVPFISFPINLGHNAIEAYSILSKTPQPEIFKNAVSVNNPTTLRSVSSEPVSAVQPIAIKSHPFDTRKVLSIIYLCGVTLMIYRFCRNIIMINRLFLKSQKVDHEWYTIALLDHPVSPFSFNTTVFINREDYSENRIADNVFRHELEHIKQSHSLDIIFFELLHIVFWFNPVLFLYKRAVQINHEYLADEAVIRSSTDIKTYANELINFINLRINVPFTSGFSPSMVRLRLMMLNTNTTGWNKNIRMLITLSASVLLMSVISVKPAYPDTQDVKNKKRIFDLNKDIVIDEANFRGPDFRQLKALIVIDGRKLGNDEILTIEPTQIKTIDILMNRKAVKKYGRIAKNGAVEITTYETNKQSAPDSLKYKPIFTINNHVPEGTIIIPVSNLYSFSIWTYPIFPNQDLKQWRTIDIMTRDYFKIKGTVIQKDGKPLPGVLLTATGNPYKVRTDKSGHFLLMDVKPDVVAGLSADGYEPFYFKVNSVVFTSDLTITLDKENESGQSNITAKYNIKDFSGTWKLNKELSKFPVTRGGFEYRIHQYDSDSIVMNLTGVFEEKEYKSKQHYVFNSVKTEKSAQLDNMSITLNCSVAEDGHSFSVTSDVKSRIGLFKEYKDVISYALSEDESQMIIHRYYVNSDSTNNRNSIIEIYDRVGPDSNN